jgi:hypothetical protein
LFWIDLSLFQDLDKKVTNKIASNEEDYYRACKTQMTKVNKKFFEMREECNKTRLEYIQNKLIISLTQKMNYFRNEAERLDGLVKMQKKTIEQMKASFAELHKDNEYFQQELAHQKKCNKSLVIQLTHCKQLLAQNPNLSPDKDLPKSSLLSSNQFRNTASLDFRNNQDIQSLRQTKVSLHFVECFLFQFYLIGI